MTQPDGDSPVTIAVVARRAGVSTATVSRVLQGTSPASDEARERVLSAVRELGYRKPPRRRADVSSLRRVHGLVLRELSAGYGAELALGHQSAAADLGQSVLLCVTARHLDATEAVRDLAARVDGLVIASATVADRVAQSVARSVPVVLIGRTQLPGCDAVMADNVRNARALTAHLLSHERTHLVFVGDPDTSPDVAERYRGFRLAHAAAAIPLRRPPLRVPLVAGAGEEVAEDILRRRVRIDGLVCANDEVALGALKRLQENGVLVPDDLAVVGWDDVEAARFVTPALTTVRQPTRQLGWVAAQCLQARIGGRDPGADPHVLPTELLIRRSCGCPP